MKIQRVSVSVAFVAAATLAPAQSPAIDLSNWGSVTAPVFGQFEKGGLLPGGVVRGALVNQLDVASGPDRDSMRLGELTRLSLAADDLHHSAAKGRKLKSRNYRKQQQKLMEQAEAPGQRTEAARYRRLDESA